MKRTWILIADGSGARILEALDSGRGFLEHAVNDGRRLSPHPHPVAERPGATRALEALFASQLSTILDGHLQNKAFDRLVIVAPATMLGKLRRMIGPAVRATVLAEVEKDLTDIPTPEISHYLDDVVSH